MTFFRRSIAAGYAFRRSRRGAFRMLAALLVATLSSNGKAAQIDIAGPAGSVSFGIAVTLLPNGNFVVIDPKANRGAQNAGAVHLYSPSGTLISTLHGDEPDDFVGGGGVAVLANGNFVVLSPGWNNGTSHSVGAATWVDGVHGLSGAVSPDNSLVGTQTNDSVGIYGAAPLSNGNYVVISPWWNNGDADAAGAVTWADGRIGIHGAVSIRNSLVGKNPYDRVGDGGMNRGYQGIALPDGNYVAASPTWTNGTAASAGAVTWIDGNIGLHGEVSASNSLVGTTANDKVSSGGIVVLANGNYVVTSSFWDNGSAPDVGAVTWVDGKKGLSGPISPINSLVGTMGGDSVGYAGRAHVTALSNGNYVVPSSGWSNGDVRYVGAVTWANGARGISGPVSVQNSLVGTTSHDLIGERIIALTNGNYVTSSANWTNGNVQLAGAATWGDGNTGRVGAVTADNSLVGTNAADFVGTEIVALSDGNYVVSSPNWSANASSATIGAITWGNGAIGTAGVVSRQNSLVETAQTDTDGVVALTNGNYVIVSPSWSDDYGSRPDIGAVAWVKGDQPAIGELSADRALIGVHALDRVGRGPVVALSNGNYVVGNPLWGSPSAVGAVTWADGRTGLSGIVSSSNSMIGPLTQSPLGNYGIVPLEDGNYLVLSGPTIVDSTRDAAITLVDGSRPAAGNAPVETSVRGIVPRNGPDLSYAYDARRRTLWVGRSSENIVSRIQLGPAQEVRRSERPIPPILLHARPR